GSHPAPAVIPPSVIPPSVITPSVITASMVSPPVIAVHPARAAWSSGGPVWCASGCSIDPTRVLRRHQGGGAGRRDESYRVVGLSLPDRRPAASANGVCYRAPGSGRMPEDSDRKPERSMDEQPVRATGLGGQAATPSAQFEIG